MISLRPTLSVRFNQYAKFCMVGASGFVVDTSVLYALSAADSGPLWLAFAKVIAAEAAMCNNFIWNHLWTFGSPSNLPGRVSHNVFRRFIKFNAICSGGILIGVILLQALMSLPSMTLLVANALAVVVASLWNFSLSAKYAWKSGSAA